MVENYLDRPGIAQLFKIGRGVASHLGVTVSEKASVVEKINRNIEIPKKCVIAALIRGSDFVVPRGETQIIAKTIV